MQFRKQHIDRAAVYIICCLKGSLPPCPRKGSLQLMKLPAMHFLTPPSAALTWHILSPRPKSHVQIIGSRASGGLQAARSVGELSPARQLRASISLALEPVSPSLSACLSPPCYPALLAVVIRGALEWPLYCDLWPKELNKLFGRAQSEQIPVSKLYLLLLGV